MAGLGSWPGPSQKELITRGGRPTTRGDDDAERIQEKIGRGGAELVEVEPIDFTVEPRFRLGEKIQELQAQVVECQQLAGAGGSQPTAELQDLADQVAKLKGILLAAAGGKVKKKRAPWGSKKKKG